MGEDFIPTRNDLLSVGTTSVQAINDKPNTAESRRKVFVIRNTSDDPTKIITLNVGNNVAVANYGIVLKQGEAYSEATDAGFQCWNGPIQAICAVAGGQLSIFER